MPQQGRKSKPAFDLAQQAQPDALEREVASLTAHRLLVEAWIASSDPALCNVEPGPMWDDEDAKAMPFNCSLPRGLKRRLEVEAKRTGLPASKLVQRLLIAALYTEEARADA